nr:YdcF family protein [uncultured Oscillibacter sp.]
MDNERMGRMVLRWGQIALAAAGLALVLVPVGIRFTGYFLWGCLGVWLAWELLARWAKRSRTGNICYRVFLCGLTLGVVSLIFIECLLLRHGEADNSDIPVDAVIVLGAGVNGETPSAALQSRINAAAAYLQKHPDVPVVLSGGQGPGERITEAEAMRRALWTNSEEANRRYLLEDRSTSTAENFRFSKALLEEYGLDTETAVVAVVTNDFHCFRTHMIAQRQGLRIIDVPAELPWWWLTANYYLREAFALVKTALLDTN